MKSKSYIQGMLHGAKIFQANLFWFEFIKRAKCKAVIEVLKIILEDSEE